MIYFDNAATTKVDPQVVSVINDSMEKDFANSGTVYRLGLEAKRKLENAEEEIAQLLSLPAYFRVIFTSCGSEANNLFIKGYGGIKKKIASLGLEHSSVLETAQFLCQEGGDYLTLSDCRVGGRLDSSCMKKMSDLNVKLLCLSHVNNELGSLNDPLQIGKVAKADTPRAKLFFDGVQALGKITINKETWDYISGYSISAHKINGPKGIGALIYDSRLALTPMIHGGKQQSGVRSGTIPVPLILGFTEAIKIALRDLEANAELYKKLSQRLIGGLKELSDKNPDLQIRFNSEIDGDWCPSIINISFSPVEGEVILHHLEESDIFVGLGSACSARSKDPSKILLGLGLSTNEARCSLRISFGPENQLEEVDSFIKEFDRVYKALYPVFRDKKGR
jgi:cysteine desulfurase